MPHMAHRLLRILLLASQLAPILACVAADEEATVLKLRETLAKEVGSYVLLTFFINLLMAMAITVPVVGGNCCPKARENARLIAIPTVFLGIGAIFIPVFGVSASGQTVLDAWCLSCYPCDGSMKQRLTDGMGLSGFIVGYLNPLTILAVLLLIANIALAVFIYARKEEGLFAKPQPVRVQSKKKPKYMFDDDSDDEGKDPIEQASRNALNSGQDPRSGNALKGYDPPEKEVPGARQPSWTTGSWDSYGRRVHPQ